MPEFPGERQLVIEVESQLEKWTNDARTMAYTELFEDDPILTHEELRLLDTIDSSLERQGGDGVWGTDRYGVHTAGALSSNRSVGIVCVYHPQITKDSVLYEEDELDDETEERLNEALWRYSERVSSLIEDELDEYLRRREG